ncbi:hypothetical protein CLG96_12920 [Sphingomonas oleivorans]|uniref:Uncharacterized protein n=1 Tax=Sphingomonas oleivorans TaxID=1735121 RepID=A0A2T5FW83_9SPHN|nr:hypothetical protein [Sphingomonas oleivorans]PTQ10040.1 hypothetical protein CLG96_12920 [Sphingomonas oleivorans]
MASVTLSATPKGNGFQATVSYDGWVSISSAETYSTMAEAISAAAIKMLDMPERLEAMDREDQTV